MDQAASFMRADGEPAALFYLHNNYSGLWIEDYVSGGYSSWRLFLVIANSQFARIT